MKIRVFTSLGIAIVGIPILIFSGYLVYPIALGILSAIAVWELLRVFGFHKRYEVSLPAYLIAALLPVFAHDIFTKGNRIAYILAVASVIFAYLLYLAAVCVISMEVMIKKLGDLNKDNGKKVLGFGDVAAIFTSVTYVTVSFSAMSLTRYMQNGIYILCLIFVAAWGCDTFAYFTGRLFGKHKLAPHLSPKKTVEGSIGGIVFAVICCIIYGFIVSLATGIKANYLVLALLGLVLSVVSQIGDLWASLIKREHGIKDYSQMLPGHGGVMDRFDSILAVSTVLMSVSMIFPPFV